jgi:hypothetical protein
MMPIIKTITIAKPNVKRAPTFMFLNMANFSCFGIWSNTVPRFLMHDDSLLTQEIARNEGGNVPFLQVGNEFVKKDGDGVSFPPL